MDGVRHHTELVVWKEATTVAAELLRWLDGEGRALPECLREAIGRAALAIGANIAAGFGRGSDPQFAGFLDLARGAAHELDSHLRVAIQLARAPESILALLPRLDAIARRIASLGDHLRTREAFEAYSADVISSPSDHAPQSTDLSHA